MSHFITQLSTEPYGGLNDDGDKHVLTGPLFYASEIAKGVIIVPEGFVTDFATVLRLPIIYWLFGNTARKAAVIHDYLYQSGRFPRAMCDAIFREASEVTGVPAFKRWGMWVGVRIGGGLYYTAPQN